MSTAIHWFRRDLRLTDNTALHRACKAHSHILPVYILSEWKNKHRWTGAPRQNFLAGCLRSLAANLESIGGRLVIRQGDSAAELESLIRSTGAEALYCNADPDPFGREVEDKIRTMAARVGCRVEACKDVWIHGSDEVQTADGQPYRVFTPYSKAWARLEKPACVPRPSRMHTPSAESLPLPDHSTWNLPATTLAVEPGEKAARQRLRNFLNKGLPHYSAKRNIPDSEGTSRLSQDLRFGTISPRHIYHATHRAIVAAPADVRRSGLTFISELIWREFYFQILWWWPEVLEQEFNPKYRGLPWSPPEDSFELWKQGRTGFPMVDAGMRQLAATGFMHNRLRMITAMFLTKDLHIDWRAGEQFFMQRLLDGEIASNNGGWQWSAGTGADAAPYFRIQNPWLQSARFDPDGEFIRTWIPELKHVPAADLHRPPPDGRPLAADYPLPMVDHHRERDVTLALFQSMTR